MLYDWLHASGRLTDDGTLTGPESRRAALMAWSDVHDGGRDGWDAAVVVAALRGAAISAKGTMVTG